MQVNVYHSVQLPNSYDEIAKQLLERGVLTLNKATKDVQIKQFPHNKHSCFKFKSIETVNSKFQLRIEKKNPEF